MGAPRESLKIWVFFNSQLKELILFILAITSCLALSGLAHYLISQGQTYNSNVSNFERAILGSLVFLSFLFGHALGVADREAARSSPTTRDHERNTMSLSLRILSAMIGMVLATISEDWIWSSGASLVAVISLVGTQFVANKSIK